MLNKNRISILSIFVFLISFFVYLQIVDLTTFNLDDDNWSLITNYLTHLSILEKVRFLSSADILSSFGAIKHSALAALMHSIPYTVYGTTKSILVFVAVAQALTVTIVFLIGNLLATGPASKDSAESLCAGLIAAFFYLFIPVMALENSLRVWQLAYMPLSLALELYFLFRYLREGKSRFFILCFIAMALAFHFHPISFILSSAVIFVLLSTTSVSQRLWSVGVSGFLFMIFPFITYQIKTGSWLNLSAGILALFFLPILFARYGKAKIEKYFWIVFALINIACIIFSNINDLSPWDLHFRFIEMVNIIPAFHNAEFAISFTMSKYFEKMVPYFLGLYFIYEGIRFKTLSAESKSLFKINLIAFGLLTPASLLTLKPYYYLSFYLLIPAVLAIGILLFRALTAPNRFFKMASAGFASVCLFQLALAFKASEVAQEIDGGSSWHCSNYSVKSKVMDYIFEREKSPTVVIVDCPGRNMCAKEGGGFNPLYLERNRLNRGRSEVAEGPPASYYYIYQKHCLPVEGQHKRRIEIASFKDTSVVKDSELIRIGTPINFDSINERIKRTNAFRIND